MVKGENGGVSRVAAEDTVGLRVTMKLQTGFVTRVEATTAVRGPVSTGPGR